MLVLHMKRTIPQPLAFINTLLATAAATVLGLRRMDHKGKPSMLGGASGAVAGLVAITGLRLRWTIGCLGDRFVGRRSLLVGASMV